MSEPQKDENRETKNVYLEKTDNPMASRRGFQLEIGPWALRVTIGRVYDG